MDALDELPAAAEFKCQYSSVINCVLPPHQAVDHYRGALDHSQAARVELEERHAELEDELSAARTRISVLQVRFQTVLLVVLHMTSTVMHVYCCSAVTIVMEESTAILVHQIVIRTRFVHASFAF